MINTTIKSNAYRCRFTLVELLVVIAIISILASLLMPTLRKAMDNTKTLSCGNNLKQIGFSLIRYQNDFNGYVCPTRIADPDGITTNRMWNDLLFYKDYVDTIKLYVCPISIEYDTVGWFAKNRALPAGNSSWWNCGYGANRMLGDCMSSNSDIKPYRRDAQIRKPSKFIQLGDAAGPYNDYYRPCSYMYTQATQASYAFPWHGELCNILYFDNHVKGHVGKNPYELYSEYGPLKEYNTLTNIFSDSPWRW